MTPEMAQNTVSMLQADPLYYRNFGVYWWHVKTELKRAGFDRDQLPHLGEYVDPDPVVKACCAGKKPATLTQEAYDFQATHAAHKNRSNHSFTPGGEVYYIRDEDVE